jgi:hypothetical protein
VLYGLLASGIKSPKIQISEFNISRAKKTTQIMLVQKTSTKEISAKMIPKLRIGKHTHIQKQIS